MGTKVKGLVSGLGCACGVFVVSVPAFAADGTDTTMGEALTNTVLGISTVFIMLIVIALIIYAFRIIPVLQKKFGKAPEPKTAARPASAPAKAKTDDLELAAVIAAAIAKSKGVSADKIQIKSITKR